MHENTSSSRQHYLFAVLLFIAGLLIILIFLSVRSQADDANTSGSIANEAPTIDSVTISKTDCGAATSTIALLDNSTNTYYVCGTYTDNNGCDEVASSSVGIKAVLYTNGATGGSSCSGADLADCYIASSNTNKNICSITSCSASTTVTANYSCLVDFQFYASNTEWTASVIAVDTDDATSTASTATTSVASLTAIDLNGCAINYGQLPFSSTSADQSCTVSNTGNQVTDFYVRATRMACDDGSISTSSIHFATGTGIAYASQYVATDSIAGAQVDIDLAKRSTSSASNQTFATKLQTPAGGVSGNCSGAITINAG